MKDEFESEIHHNNAYLFISSERARKHSSGLDYSKIIIINNNDYLGDMDRIIDQDEYVETVRNLKRIKEEAMQYIDDYVMYQKGSLMMKKKDYRGKYRYSTLQYFHKELGIS